MKKVQGVTRAQSTTDKIRQMIIEGKFKPGDRLQAQMLGDLLGVSRTPVSDALAVLHKEGLLEYGANRGYGVKRFDLDSLLDAFDVRLTLEGLGARLVAERGMKSSSLAAVHKNLAETEALLFGERWTNAEQQHWRLLNLAFHDLLLAEANNAYLTAGVTTARALPPIFDSAFRKVQEEEFWPMLQRPFSQQAFRDHERIIEAIEAGQGTRAEAMMKEHIYSSREKMRRIIVDLRKDALG